MERSSVVRWLLIGLGIFLLLQVFDPFGSKKTELQPLTADVVRLPETRAPEQLCHIWTPSFHAQLSTRGASLKRFALLSGKYRHDGQPIELSTTPDLELHRSLRFNWRNGAGTGGQEWQVEHSSLDWQLEKSDAKTCEFVYRDAETEIRKVVRATERPYELDVKATIKNLAATKQRHALAVHTDAWRTQSEVAGSMLKVSPFVSHVECVFQDGDSVRLKNEDFDADDFKAAEFTRTAINPGDWYQPKPRPDVVAISNAYFTQALVPLAAPPNNTPSCQLLIEHRWNDRAHKSASADPNAGWMYRARLAYDPVELGSGESATYGVLAYVGPKEREVLAAAAAGGHHLDEIIDLGFFSTIAKVLVAFLLKVHSIIPNWGIAIVLLTITARLLLFPLSIPSIKSMIKMRELKPELDALNEKYKNDPQAKGLAQMELWRKHNVNPFKGCLPQLASMPVWFALYTTLQTAVELYNIPFLWFPDLSQPDPYFVLPLIIGATYFVQQRIMPMQGDPMQQKMMMYMMPAMFTVFMLFLPAGLGVYMFTNSVLGIAQQQAVERHARRNSGGGGGDIKVKITEGSDPKTASGKAERGKDGKLADGSPLLRKGKA